MMSQTAILQTIEDGVATLTFNRPERHNAFDDALIAELHEKLEALAAEQQLRALVLTGAGDSFSAGADLNWMRRMADNEEAANREDALRLAAMFRALDGFPRPVVAKVNGHAFGGGFGLVACADIVVAESAAMFGLTEVKLGLIPATIAPYVVRRIGDSQTRRLALTGMRIDADEARRIGLVHELGASHELDARLNNYLERVRKAGPQAVMECKALLRQVRHYDGSDPEREDRETSEWIARVRVSEEGQHGLRAFLEKKAPEWK